MTVNKWSSSALHAEVFSASLRCRRWILFLLFLQEWRRWGALKVKRLMKPVVSFDQMVTLDHYSENLRLLVIGNETAETLRLCGGIHDSRAVCVCVCYLQGINRENTQPERLNTEQTGRPLISCCLISVQQLFFWTAVSSLALLPTPTVITSHRLSK